MSKYRRKITVDAAYNGEDALAFPEAAENDACISDTMMPKTDGITVLKKARSAGIQTPILLPIMNAVNYSSMVSDSDAIPEVLHSRIFRSFPTAINRPSKQALCR